MPSREQCDGAKARSEEPPESQLWSLHCLWELCDEGCVVFEDNSDKKKSDMSLLAGEGVGAVTRRKEVLWRVNDETSLFYFVFPLCRL
jgi:hypothetical protein